MTSPATPTTDTHAPEPAPATPSATPATPSASAATTPEVGTPTPAPAPEPSARASARAESGAAARRSPDVRAGARRAASLTGAGIKRLRTLLGEIVWFACLLAATALLLGAVLVVLEANTRNALVEAVLKAADWADLGVFSRTAGVKQFTGDGATVKNAITNWGLGAVAWLVVGRVARRILTPRS
ncbi:hypothetical protein GCM10009721_15260 [Terrabacter tumescens]|uniref:Uncharacterized protein n=1 Tax=Terrabacter tumescens TaxID=60443 RepID=A0ABQ2HT02_9MICO|nr:hypothetical protein [Terrabacter tumescens]GGM90707.1 hypothetical protein GCM10009721_15260 [Terrabacter tumescens]